MAQHARSLSDGKSAAVGVTEPPEVHLARRGANVEAAVTRNGDDRQPLLTFMLFDAQA